MAATATPISASAIATEIPQREGAACANGTALNVSPTENLRWCGRGMACHVAAIMVSPDRLTALFAQYHAPLVRFLTRRLGDRDWAEEIAQETFVRALRQETITSERSWLFAVASNLVRDEARRDARHRRRLELLREQTKADAVVEPEPTSMERAGEQALARRAVETLAERDRDALLMREEGLSYDEIATALDLSVGSVGTTLSRARRRLMEAYETLQAERNVRPA
jgi:RNA polymerase sigma-70 factor (ECF subfamily)